MPSVPALPYVSLAHRWLTHKWRTMCSGSHRLAQDPELAHWQCNYLLNEVTPFSLFDEFMEMSAWAVGSGDAGGIGWGSFL